MLEKFKISNLLFVIRGENRVRCITLPNRKFEITNYGIGEGFHSFTA